MSKVKAAAALFSPHLTVCAILVLASPASSQESARNIATEGPIKSLDLQSDKPSQQKPGKKQKANKAPTTDAKTDAKGLGLDPSTLGDQSISLKNSVKGSENPLSVNGRWSASNDPNYGLYSTTTQTDIYLRNQGEPTKATPNKFELGLDYKY